jgi:invasion protein IalB
MSKNRTRKSAFLFCAAAVAVAGMTVGILPVSKAGASAGAAGADMLFRPGVARMEVAQTTAMGAEGGLPGGASSLQEAYQDWQVICSAPNGAAACALSQQQADPQSRQRVFSMELQAAGAGGSGVLVLPFGLLLEAGVSVSVDEQADAMKFGFRTCVSAGCVVMFELDEGTVAAMRAGTVLKVVVTPTSNDGPIEFAVSLKGFSQAFDRVLALGGPRLPT